MTDQHIGETLPAEELATAPGAHADDTLVTRILAAYHATGALPGFSGGDHDDDDDDDDSNDDNGDSTQEAESKALKAAKREAQRLRKRLRDTESERDDLKSRVESAEEAAREAVAKELKDAQEARESAETRLRDITAQAAVTKAAAGAHALDPDAIYALTRAHLEYADDGTPSNVDDALKAVKEAHPALFQASGGSANGGEDGDNKSYISTGDTLADAYAEAG